MSGTHLFTIKDPPATKMNENPDYCLNKIFNAEFALLVMTCR